MENRTHPNHVSIFIRRLIIVAICFLLSTVIWAAEEEKKTPVVHQKGKLFILKENVFTELEEKVLPTLADTIRVGEIEDIKKLIETPDQLKEASAVLSYSEQDLLTLTNGSTAAFIPKAEEKAASYTISGAVHLFIKQAVDGTPVSFKLNDISIETTGGHLFYNSLTEVPELTLVDGAATVSYFVQPSEPESKDNVEGSTAKDATSDSQVAGSADATADTGAVAVADATSDTAAAVVVADASADSEAPKATESVPAEPVEKKIVMEKESRLVLKEGDYQLIEKVDLAKDEFYVQATLPGFEVNGAYAFTGKAVFENAPLKIIRYKKESLLQFSPAILMQGDTIQTIEGQDVLLVLDSKDDIKVSEKSEFILPEDSVKESEKPVLFKFTGKIRAKISKRKKSRRLLFKTATATIAIKGTIFEAVATKGEKTEVATIEGTVGVSDPAGKGEVLVQAGMMTSIAANALPLPPAAIPPLRLQQLYDDAIPGGTRGVIPLKIIKIVNPVELQTYSKPMVQFEIDPPEANVEFLLNAKRLIIRNGSVLANLNEGTHKLTIKGLGENPISQTVTFNIDKTPPALAVGMLADSFILRQGMPFVLSWTEAVKEFSVTFNGVALTSVISADAKRTTIESAAVFQGAKTLTQAALSFKVLDKAGNAFTFDKTIPVQFKPAAPPALVIGAGKSILYLNTPKEIQVTADRDVETWSVTLNQKPLILPQPIATADGSTKQTSKKQLTLPAVLFQNLPESAHQLEISAVDGFKMTGRQKLTMVFDRTLPKLIDPASLISPLIVPNEVRRLMFAQLQIKEGEGLRFSSMEPLVKADLVIQVTGQKFPLLLTADRRFIELPSTQVKQIFGQMQTSKVRLEIADDANNKTILDGQLIYLPKPVVPPLLKIGNGESLINADRIRSFEINSNRNIYQWAISFNGKKMDLQTKKFRSAVPGKKYLVLKDWFPKVKDGKHELLVTGIDRFNMVGHQMLKINLDSVKPVVIKTSKPIRFNRLKLGDRDVLHLTWSKRLVKIDSKLSGKSWPLELSGGGKKLTLTGDKKRLTYAPQKYWIKVVDQVGNFSILEGVVIRAKPRWQALKDNHKETIMLSTGDPLDSMSVTNRPAFQFDKAKPVPQSKEVFDIKELAFPKKPKSKFIQELNEPAITGFQ